MLLAVNLVPLVGALALGWDVYPLVMLYWAENVTVGCFTVLRMFFARGDASEGWVAKLVFTLFFVVHYGAFAAGHGVFVMAFFRTPGGVGTAGSAFGWAVAVLAASHGFSFVWNYLLGGECRRARLADLMLQPYRRVVVLHVVIVFGGILVMAMGSPAAGLVVLVLVKTGMDWHAHEREHRVWRVAAS